MTNVILSRLRNNKLAAYIVAGFLGGGVGWLLGEPLTEHLEQLIHHLEATRTTGVVWSGLWMAAVAGVLAGALFGGSEWYQRHDLKPDRIIMVCALGALAGFVSGGVAQWIYTIDNASDESIFQNVVLRTCCWALMGCLLGLLLSKPIPNLIAKRGALAGAVGGAVGCVGFLIAVQLFASDVFARLIGMVVLGVALALAMYVVETVFREASVEVLWAPYETTTVGLGANPVTIGGGNDTIFLRGKPERVSSLIMKDGQIEHIETSNGKRIPLEDGSRIRIGGVEMVIHAAK